MKLSYPQLASHLATTLCPLYLISGEEILLIQEAVQAIREAAVKAGFTERLVTPSEADCGHYLYADTHTISLFATKRTIELDLRNIKLNSDSIAILANYVANPSAETILIIKINKLDAKIEKMAWYKSIEKKGVVLTVWPISPLQLPQWIMQRGTKVNLTFTLASATYLATHVEGNMLAAAQEIEKLSLLYTAQTITPAIINETVTDNAKFDIFQLIDCIFVGDGARSLRILKNLTHEEIEPTLILWALTREIRLVATLHHELKQGVTLTTAFQKLHLWEKRQISLKSCLKRHSESNCWSFLIKTAIIDKIIKGIEKGNVWQALEDLILMIVGNGIMSSCDSAK